MINPKFFKSQSDFREWLDKNHSKESEIWVGYYKVGTGIPSLTWSQSVDQALCYGWIDGIRKSVDAERYCIRFTPRRPSSNWSKVNIAKVKELTRMGLMKPSGLKVFKVRKIKVSESYSYESDNNQLPVAFEKQFKNDQKAWDFFSAQAPSYQRMIIRWIMSAKQEKTRLSRLEKIIEASDRRIRIS